MRGGNGTRREQRRRCGWTTSPSRGWGARRQLGWTTWDAMPAGSTWAVLTSRQPLPSAHPPLVERGGTAAVSGGDTPVHPRRERRQQRLAGAVLDRGTAAGGRGDRSGAHGLPRAARHEHREHDRAPSLRMDQPARTWETTDERRGDSARDRCHHHGGRTHGAVSTRHRTLPCWTDGIGCGDGDTLPPARRFPRRMERHHFAASHFT